MFYYKKQMNRHNIYSNYLIKVILKEKKLKKLDHKYKVLEMNYIDSNNLQQNKVMKQIIGN